MISDAEQQNYEMFRECLGESAIQRLNRPQKTARKRAAKNGRTAKNSRAGKTTGGDEAFSNDHAGAGPQAELVASSNDPGELADFIEYVSEEMFPALPEALRLLNHMTFEEHPSLAETYTEPISTTTVEAIAAVLPVTAVESLTAYILPADARPDAADQPWTAIIPFLSDVLSSYISTAAKPPPLPSSTRPASNACEICDRTQLPLTYHHLIPRAVHAKVVKRGWHPKEKLNSVAWLCRQCHSFVHRCANNEELAREWYSVERLLEREDVRAFAAWVSKVRWKAR